MFQKVTVDVCKAVGSKTQEPWTNNSFHTEEAFDFCLYDKELARQYKAEEGQRTCLRPPP